ncbi:hypothetical protein B0T21DRAFT_280461 [Apiosordaria backusii]|uniref:Uncharacterized protein n=1 Tax=Apiosordaria backusii TaxID=314023 RepID=A0AA40ETR5_9PEZI|nr:hypothetical protein B0T21DRAFT_280461 [Apiosordaria backusii]
MSFIYPLVQALSQQRWNWFKTPRSLDDFRVFDEASRGPWGSLILMVRMKGRPLGILSCLVLITSIATSTLTQSVVTYPSHMVPVIGNDTAIARKVDEFYYTSGVRANGRLFPIQQALRSSGSVTPTQPLPYLPPICRTPECTWPEFNTMAVCVNMTNVTNLLTYDDFIPGTPEWHRNGRPRTNVSLPNGVKFQPYPYNIKAGKQIGLEIAIGAGITSNWSEPQQNQVLASLSFNGTEGQKAELTSVFLLYSQPIRATEIMFHHCVNRYNMSISSNVPKTQLLSSTTKVEYHDDEHPRMYKYLIDPQDPNITYKFGSTSNLFIVDMLAEFFLEDAVNCTGRKAMGTIQDMFSILLYQLPFSRPNQDQDSDDPLGKDLFQYDIIRNMSLNIAMGLTNVMFDNRTLALSSVVPGTAWQEETYISVRWEWLSLVAAQIGLSLLVLLIVMIQTSILGVPVVKSSILPAFFAVGLAERAEAERGRRDPMLDHQVYQEVKGSKEKGATPEESYALMGDLQKTQNGKWVLESLYRRRH